MNELKKGDFCGIYTRETGEPLFYTGIFDRMTDEDGRPCVFLATDPDNKNTFYRWTQSDLLKRGYYISKTGKNTIPRTAARLHIIFTHSGALDGVRATVERDMFGEWIITTETGEKYAGIVGQLRNAAFCVILKTETAEEIATRPQEGPTAPESTTAGENTTGADKAPEEATTRPKRRTAYMVECRSPRGRWIQYSGEKDTREEAEKIKEEAEAQRACTVNGDLILYRIVQIDKGPETAPQDAPTARQTAGTNAAEETPTDANKARQEASQDATPATAASTAESVPECPTTAGTIAADTRTAGATKTTPQGKERATAAGGIAAQMKNANKPGHACENAPGRTERAQAEQVHTAHTKSPPRAAQRATTHGRPRGHPEKTANFGRFYPLLDFSRTIFANFQGIPISVCIFGPVFDPEFWRQKRHPPGG